MISWGKVLFFNVLHSSDKFKQPTLYNIYNNNLKYTESKPWMFITIQKLPDPVSVLRLLVVFCCSVLGFKEKLKLLSVIKPSKCTGMNEIMYPINITSRAEPRNFIAEWHPVGKVPVLVFNSFEVGGTFLCSVICSHTEIPPQWSDAHSSAFQKTYRCPIIMNGRRGEVFRTPLLICYRKKTQHKQRILNQK